VPKAGVAINYGDRPASSPYTTRAAIRPDRRLKSNHPGGAGYRSDGRRRKTPLRTPDIAKRVEPSEASAQNPTKVSSQVEPSAAFVASSSSPSDLLPVQHEADGCGLPASSTGPRRANGVRAVPPLAVSSPKEAAKKWALRPPSRAQRRQRRPHGRAMPPMGDASRSELSNPAFGCPNTKRAPGRGVRPYTARSASLRGRPPLTTSGAGRWSAHIQASEPKCAHLVIRATPIASPRELSNPTQSTTRALS
jgi:hypothetical protein